MSTFSINLADRVAKAKIDMETAARKMLFMADNKLVNRSPVGDATLWTKEFVAAATKLGWIVPGYVGGRFRCAWQYGFNSINLTVPPVSHSSYPSAQETIDRLEVAINAAPVAGIHFLSNNLPYAMALENGHSGQAPAGVVALTVVELSR